MKDTIIKGSGNSRTIKTIPNGATIYPDFLTFIQAFATSGIPIDLLGLNAAGINQAGTDLNKANLLPDAVEQAIWGSAADRNVGQALQQLRSLITTAQSTANGRAKIQVGSYRGTDAYGNTYNSLTFDFAPKLVFISSGDRFGILYCMDIRGWGTITGYNSTTQSSWYVQLSVTGNTVKWVGINAQTQFNQAALTYQYVAIG